MAGLTNIAKILAALAILCFAVFGLLYTFGVVPPEFFSENGPKIGMAIGVLFIAALALKLLGGSGSDDNPEPPPVL